METIEQLIKDLEAIKSQQKLLSEKETTIKEELLELMLDNGIDNSKSDYGSVRIQRRAEKDYGPEIRSLEIDLKERKKLADDMGDYTILGTKESIVFSPPKDIF
jgi:hypothetical protein